MYLTLTRLVLEITRTRSVSVMLKPVGTMACKVYDLLEIQVSTYSKHFIVD